MIKGAFVDNTFLFWKYLCFLLSIYKNLFIAIGWETRVCLSCLGWITKY